MNAKHAFALVSTAAIMSVMMTPALAQNAPGSGVDVTAPDTSSQVDITHGMAEQSAMHAMQNVPPSALAQYQNYASGGYAQNHNSAQTQTLQGFATENAMQSQQFQGQYQNQQCQPQQFQMAQNQGCIQNNQQMQQCQPAQNYGGQSCNQASQNGGSSGFMGTGVSQQMVGVLGAAVLFNYMTNGGIQNLAGEMGARGWNNHLRTHGPGGVVYH